MTTTTPPPPTPLRSLGSSMRRARTAVQGKAPNPALRERQQRNPSFVEAVVADARSTAAYRGERHEFRSGTDTAVQVVRLCLQADAYLAQVLYRAKASLQARGVPGLPRLCHRLAMASAQVCIGDPVLIGPGLYLPHGQVVIDGITELGPNCVVRPWVTIGLREGNYSGPTLGQGVSVGTGAKLIGAIQIGDRAKIGANAVVTRDVPSGATAVGVPARVVGS